jgi:CDGSH-type Zn-finger protein
MTPTPTTPVSPQGITGNLQPGVYWWCSCARSKEQPFCDGTHVATTCLPVEFRIARPARVTLCVCKHTHAVPYCDNSCTHPENQT